MAIKPKRMKWTRGAPPILTRHQPADALHPPIPVEGAAEETEQAGDHADPAHKESSRLRRHSRASAKEETSINQAQRTRPTPSPD